MFQRWFPSGGLFIQSLAADMDCKASSGLGDLHQVVLLINSLLLFVLLFC